MADMIKECLCKNCKCNKEDLADPTYSTPVKLKPYPTE